MKLHVIMACHNRRELTVRALNSAMASAKAASVEADFTVFDDGSVDGTAEALTSLGSPVTVLYGDGSAYWARSMATAEAAVLARSEVRAESDSWIVWLNDDVLVDESAVMQFLHHVPSLSVAVPQPVSVGAMRDPLTGVITYGGLAKTGWHPLRFAQVRPGVVPLPVDSFNGNLVFVPLSVARALGGMDGAFSHALADIDYGLRCRRLQVPVVLLPASLGTCPRNRPEPNDGLHRKWRRFVGAKGGGNLSSLIRIIQKGAPRTWPFYVAATYLLWWVRGIAGSAGSRRGTNDAA